MKITVHNAGGAARPAYIAPTGQYFEKNYVGEFNPEAVRAEAKKYGIPFKSAVPQRYAVPEDRFEGGLR